MNTNILLVEDSRDDEELVLLALRQAGISADVAVARDGEQAVARLGNAAEMAAMRMVLLDLKVPKLNGFEVLKRIRANDATRRLPVVVFTSSDVRSDIERAYELGANCYVCKPVDFVEYSDVVQQIGRFWLALNRKV
ncbi:MAG: response regulator [Planctomycetes bacterium]|nr:response regulator [Planctomycetota bacterium]